MVIRCPATSATLFKISWVMKIKAAILVMLVSQVTIVLSPMPEAFKILMENRPKLNGSTQAV